MEFVYRPIKEFGEGKLESEFGSSMPIRWPDPSCVTMYDRKGNAMEIPICDKCGACKSQLIGKEAFKWICTICGE